MASNRDLAARFGRAASPTKAHQPDTSSPIAEETPGEPKGSKFTVIFSREDAEAFDEFLLGARRHLGRRVDKSEVVRCLLQLAYDDPSLEQELLDRLEKRR